MITVDEARARLLDLVGRLDEESVLLTAAAGRVLAGDAVATRAQPPFASSSMDGYAVIAAEVEPGAMFEVIGEAAAGHRFDGAVGPGQAVRIFTGAPVPEGADFVVIQEDVERRDQLITITTEPGGKSNIRPAGSDFAVGDRLPAPRRLTPEDVALLASMNLARVNVVRAPQVALIATGDELALPGETPGPDQIIASNGFGLKALFEAAGARARLLPVARDTRASLETAFGLAGDADLVVTIGGASVGDHDLVGQVAEDLGMQRAFYKVAMRPGKPLMAGRLRQSAMVGLPGNAVSAMVCGRVFILPMLNRMLGLPDRPPDMLRAPLGGDISANGPRTHFMRARFDGAAIAPFGNQDSSLLTVLSQANALLVRAPGDPARRAGEMVEYLPL